VQELLGLHPELLPGAQIDPEQPRHPTRGAGRRDGDRPSFPRSGRYPNPR
jgi:hypothetical protein